LVPEVYISRVKLTSIEFIGIIVVYVADA
jgi:hypothetical protein